MVSHTLLITAVFLLFTSFAVISGISVRSIQDEIAAALEEEMSWGGDGGVTIDDDDVDTLEENNVEDTTPAAASEEEGNLPTEAEPPEEPAKESIDADAGDDESDDNDNNFTLDDDANDEEANGDEEANDDEEANGYEGDGVVLKRKKRAASKEWVLSKSNHPMDVKLVMLDNPDHHRVKRTSFNITTSMWPHRIPWIYDKTYKQDRKHQLEEVMKFLENHLCVEFKHEQDFDPNNPNWFKEHGYTTNAYIQFRTKKACTAVFGRGAKDRGGRKISPCTQWISMMHEVMHSLGGIHSQNYPYRERYITMHDDNIEPRMKHNFKKFEPDSTEVEYEDFDPTSLLMYARSYFSINGQFTFDYVRPEMSHLFGPNTYRNILFEMNKAYKCQETFCKDENPDCGVGYMGYVNRKCGCVCPSGFDPASNCKSIRNAADTSISWPDTAYSLYKSDDDCPAGMESGRVPLNVGQSRMNLKKLSAAGRVVNIDMCSKTSGGSDYGSWPVGSYCIVKAKDVPCGEPFKEGELVYGTSGTMTLTGSVGDVTVNGNKVSIKYCCREEGDTRVPMKLPTDQPFRLTMSGLKCQEIEDMWTLSGYIILKGKHSKKGSAPRVGINRHGIKQTSCYYQPPTYGCSQEVMLDSSNPSVTVSVPMDGSSRAPNKRCFYYFQAAEGSRLRLTFKKIKIHPSDQVFVKRFNLLENSFKIDTKRPPYQMITEKHQLMVEYWSYYLSSRSLSGADFQVDLLAPEGLCYDAASKGADYAGKKEVSETYEGCVPWKDAVACPDFPWDGTNGLHLLNSGKSCRNLDTTGMFQPWCYSYVNGTMCQRRYCDVCNEADPVDVISNCQSHISKNPNFCSESLARFGCFKSCGMDTASYNKAGVKCSKPIIPSEITASGSLQESYEIGAKVGVSCGEIECTSHGWTPFDDACTAGQCVDASQLCENALSKFSGFCTDEKSKQIAEKYCKKTCGKCGAAACSVSNGESFSSSASSVSTGQDVSFACNDGLSHASGDLSRACSATGSLLGDEPVCDAQQMPADINIQQIFEKTRTIPRVSAYLMLGYGLDVPFDGKISRWYYYCANDRVITLLVYRKTGNAKRFKLVGYNEAPCVKNWPWTHDVPAADQIAVKKGDILGVYDQRGSIVMQPCQAAKQKWAPNATTRARKIKGLIGKKVSTFRRIYCAYLGIGARVTPA